MKITWFPLNWTWPTTYIVGREGGAYRGLDIGPLNVEWLIARAANP